MAVAPTGNIFKALSFDNVSSRAYGVYITGEAVYNAPGRDVEMVEIPGRNGSFALDKGRFQNIEVSYPAGIFADNETDFAEAISDFRNFLCSRRGYVRLTDEYNPNEYRMAIYKSGLEVTPAQLKAGEFNIVFDCKPQRWLTSGENAVTVANNGTLTNPTLFDSSPLLAVEGYGTIGFNGYEIELENVELGEVQLSTNTTIGTTGNTTLDTQFINSGDAIYVHNGMIVRQTIMISQSSTAIFHSATATSMTNATEASADIQRYNRMSLSFRTNWGNGFVYGTSKTITSSTTYDVVVRSNGTDYPASITMTLTAVYNGSKIISVTKSVTWTGTGSNYLSNVYTTNTIPPLYGDSSQSALGHPTYIDCDLGEAYMTEGESLVSLNQHIDLGSDLPKLASGTNEITYDNTITELKITPRWWKV